MRKAIPKGTPKEVWPVVVQVLENLGNLVHWIERFASCPEAESKEKHGTLFQS
jgi:hypothetical protein